MKYLGWHNRTKNFIRDYQATNGISPSIREIQLALGVSSTSVVIGWLRQLEKTGEIIRTPGRARSFRLAEPVQNVGNTAAQLIQEFERHELREIISLLEQHIREGAA